MATRQREQVIRRLCSGETYKRACNILKQVDLVCAPGTGYTVSSEGTAGIPAICAYLASEQLNNTDVTERVARTASCLKPKIFDQTLDLVGRALDEHYKKQEAEERRLFYLQMMRSYKVGRTEFLRGQMERAENELIESGKLRSKRTRHFEQWDEAIPVAVFYWTCSKCGKALNMRKRDISPQTLARHYDVEARDIVELFNILENVCRQTGKEIGEAVKRMDSSRRGVASTSVSPTKSQQSITYTPTSSRPSSPAKGPSPMKSALRKNVYDTLPEQMKTPTHKRNITFLDFDAEPEDTPTKPKKRRKFAGSAESDGADHTEFYKALTTPRAPDIEIVSQRPATSSSGVALVDTEDYGEDVVLPVAKTDKTIHDELERPGDGLQSDNQASEMEVEGYIDTIVPLNDTDNDEIEPSRVGEDDANLPVEIVQHSPRVVILPTTPQTVRQFPVTPTRTPVRKESTRGPSLKSQYSVSVTQLPSSDEECEPKEPEPRRRCRPALLSHRQWLARDSRVVKQARLAEAWKKGMTERHGYPPELDRLRVLAIGSEQII